MIAWKMVNTAHHNTLVTHHHDSPLKLVSTAMANPPDAKKSVEVGSAGPERKKMLSGVTDLVNLRMRT
jgi:hypothetical protein